jgi:hypothetical protein
MYRCKCSLRFYVVWIQLAQVSSRALSNMIKALGVFIETGEFLEQLSHSLLGVVH